VYLGCRLKPVRPGPTITAVCAVPHPNSSQKYVLSFSAAYRSQNFSSLWSSILWRQARISSLNCFQSRLANRMATNVCPNGAPRLGIDPDLKFDCAMEVHLHRERGIIGFFALTTLRSLSAAFAAVDQKYYAKAGFAPGRHCRTPFCREVLRK